MSVATPDTLYRMEKETVRPRDWDDAARWKQHFDRKDD